MYYHGQFSAPQEEPRTRTDEGADLTFPTRQPQDEPARDELTYSLGMQETRLLTGETTPPGPSAAAMHSVYEKEAGKPWVDGDPFCVLFERSWRSSWESAFRWAPDMAASMAESVEAKYLPPAAES